MPADNPNVPLSSLQKDNPHLSCSEDQNVIALSRDADVLDISLLISAGVWTTLVSWPLAQLTASLHGSPGLREQIEMVWTSRLQGFGSCVYLKY
ncbi:hypothetical protein NQZ68_025210 [Dissostichus eleginoides]|nr:hypothetical protein NQZ68_025210 [Dissostichus eleginoides]